MLANATGEIFRLAKSGVAWAPSKLLAFPVHLLGRIRRLSTDVRWMHSSLVNDFAPADHPDLFSNGILLSRSPPPPAFITFPGPWGFLTSWYILGLFMMAVLLHRIRNIVVPPRNQFINRFSRMTRRHVIFHLTIPSIFPLDMTSSIGRLVLRSPTLYLVFRMLFIWIIVLAQAVDKFPPWNSSWLQSVGTYVAQSDTADICWYTFCAVCGVLAIEAITHGLEGGVHHPSPFNLLGYAYLLHIYSSPVTHRIKLEGSTSRPDKHVVFTIMLPLLQLAMIHLIGIKQTWSSHRFLPSAFVSILGLAHFHSVIWLSDSSYPLLNFAPCLFESSLLAVIFLALFLNVFTQIITEGHVSRVLFGHQAALLPKWDEDFSVALLRMGTASFEVSSVLGLGHEVGGISAIIPLPLNEPGSVELNRCGVASLFPAVEGFGKHRRSKKGFSNEIKTVRASSTEGDLWLDMVWYRELAQFAVGLARCIRGLIVFSWSVLRWRSRSPNLHSRREANRGEVAKSERNRDPGVKESEEELYARFVRGEPIHDDDEDDDDFEYRQSEIERDGSASPTSSTFEDDDEGCEEEDLQQDASETVSLFSDLSSSPSGLTSASVLLAHMTDNSSSPMTRRRFQHLVSAPSQSSDSLVSDWTDVAAKRRSPSSGTGNEDSIDEARRNCVICTVDPRQIICWPCRCLALCDDCRENLASRASASAHTCPCCRRK